MFSGPGTGSSGAGTRTTTRAPALTRWPGSRIVVPATATSPAAEGAPPSPVAASETKPSGAEDTPAAEKPSAAAEPAPLDPAAARVIAKVRRLMVVSTLFTALTVTAVLGVIGYRVFRS